MNTEVSPLIRDTIGKITFFFFDGTPLFFLFTASTIGLYFQTSRNAALAKAVAQLKEDFGRERQDRVAVVQAVSKIPGVTLPRSWEEGEHEFAKLEPLQGIQNENLDHITWSQVNALAKSSQLNSKKHTNPSIKESHSGSAAQTAGAVQNPMHTVQRSNSALGSDDNAEVV